METDIYEMDPTTYSKLMNFHFIQILDQPSKYSQDEYIYAQNWQQQNWNVRKSILVQSLQHHIDHLLEK